ncbi:MAG: hypothetical protein H0W40_04640 [Methylibium sp.]|uniref:hypothetical protein n=1 Tax=Methylibium sp. TaxID=2067992 RepID=UPI00183D7E4D|nr:hypothetical protein [Methylibium sp.]MBA3596650.1 hypothetical protein [Methylibium sp.]
MLSELPIELLLLPLLPAPLVAPPPEPLLVAPEPLPMLLPVRLLLPGVDPVEEVEDVGDVDEVGNGVWVVAM